MDKHDKFKIITEGQEHGVSVTCIKYKISRTLYYRWLNRYKNNGLEGLGEIKKHFQPINKTPDVVDKALLKLIYKYPTYGPRALKYLLEDFGYNISESAVFNIMKRHDLTNKAKRHRFINKKKNKVVEDLPNFTSISCGQCWLFWITSYGDYEGIGPVFEYTLYDMISKIACTRFYNNITLANFEDLLGAVALPVAQTLQFDTKYLCFLDENALIKKGKKFFTSEISKIIDKHGFNVSVHILNEDQMPEEIKKSKHQYTEGCLSFLLKNKDFITSFMALKIKFQHYIRYYNMENENVFEDMRLTPVSFYNQQTGTKLILPLWAYIDRDY